MSDMTISIAGHSALPSTFSCHDVTNNNFHLEAAKKSHLLRD